MARKSTRKVTVSKNPTVAVKGKAPSGARIGPLMTDVSFTPKKSNKK